MIYNMFGEDDFDSDVDRVLYYDIEKNLMFDEMNFEIPDIFNIISPSMLWLFKFKKKDMLVYGIHGDLIGLMYPIEDEDHCYRF